MSAAVFIGMLILQARKSSHSLAEKFITDGREGGTRCFRSIIVTRMARCFHCRSCLARMATKQPRSSRHCFRGVFVAAGPRKWLAGPLVIRAICREQRCSTCAVLYSSSDSKSRNLYFAAVVERRRLQRRSVALLPPLFYQSSGTNHSTVITPLWASGHDHRRMAALIPLYSPDQRNRTSLGHLAGWLSYG